MAAYHVVLVHFPIALWMTASLAILFRAMSDSQLAITIDRALVPLLTIALIFGLAAYIIGVFVWPREAITASPIARNHILTATWTTGYWAAILWLRKSNGQAVWRGMMRWVMAFLALVGATLLGITGTLGGHLIGVYTDVSKILRQFGWEVYTTLYVPNLTLAAIAVITALLIGLGLTARKANP